MTALRYLPFVIMAGSTLAASNAQTAGQPVRWACVGNSLTAGTSYPQKLAVLLGSGFSLQSFGAGGMTALKSGHRWSPTDTPGSGSYWTTGKLAEVFAFRPEIVSIELGTNDSKPMNWADSANFTRDYSALIDTLSSMPSPPRIIPLLPCPVWTAGINYSTVNDSNIRIGIIPRIRGIAAKRSLTPVDCYSAFAERPDLFIDGVHPDSAGCDTLAAAIYRTFNALFSETRKPPVAKTGPPFTVTVDGAGFAYVNTTQPRPFEVTVITLAGKTVAVHRVAGKRSAVFSVRGLGAGMYVLHVQAGANRLYRKIIIGQ
jgi:hypothetical protein